MRSFLGQALFFQPFVRYYAILAAPLNAAISGSSDLRTTPALVDAFDKLKDGIANAATLAPLDYSLPIIVRPDASMVGVGGGVWNRLPDGTLRLVLMVSKPFSAVARRWKVKEQEGFDICLLHHQPVRTSAWCRVLFAD